MPPIDNVLVTGGTGFVGYWMSRTGAGRFLNRQDYQGRWENGHWDYIVHLANVSPSRVLKYAQKHGTRVLYCSSGAVYDGSTGYAYDKRLWETECTVSGVDVVITRLFTFVGARLKNKYAITQFIEAAKAGKPLEVWGGGRSIRSYLYGEDLGRWMWKILFCGSGVYDVGSAVPYSILEVARIVAEVIPANIVIGRDEEPTEYLPDVQAAIKLGCRETVGLREAIERTVNEA